MKIIGRINIEIYKCATNKKIITDDVVLTENRIHHIIERRGLEFYNKYKPEFKNIIENPDYIFKDIKADTVLASKSVDSDGKNVNIVLRLAVEGDDPCYKNSIITAIKENEKRFLQRLRNGVILYKRVDCEE
ncbi:MAG TPA: hypothetical protein IAA60_08480 [Candidatus Ornithomonoglobus intestinigallinarum]|uniref:Phage-Barnase-EndoU-ColicinE5/D-RelE like nuclease 2 domain-containing protein n=1 Tax=Candidatus Ornithomonoglobus intestinigallinarum TaxID=2840894 RepID=A0A9D1H446_9FIRM|nr:hypothetical protein [Candidatus Ornithomonoglobus intestinigallinarum]